MCFLLINKIAVFNLESENSVNITGATSTHRIKNKIVFFPYRCRLVIKQRLDYPAVMSYVNGQWF